MFENSANPARTADRRSAGSMRLYARIAATEHLTAREIQVAELTMQGLSYTEIADELELSPNTIKTYRQSLYAKLGINSRRELFAMNKP